MKQLILIPFIILNIYNQCIGQSNNFPERIKANHTVAIGELSTLSINYERYFPTAHDLTIVGRVGFGIKGSERIFDNSSSTNNITHGIGIMKGWSGHHIELAYIAALDFDSDYTFAPSIAYRYYFPFGLNLKLSLSQPFNRDKSVTSFAGDRFGFSAGYIF